MKRLATLVVLLLVASASFAQGVPSPATPRIMTDSTGQLNDATHGVIVKLEASSTVTVGSLTSLLVTTVGPTGNATDPVSVIGTTSTPIYVAPASTSIGVAGANATSPLAVQLMLSDNSTLQRWFSMLVQGDGVNGNNMGSVGLYGWNGATYDRLLSSTTDGLRVNLASTTVHLGTETLTVTATIASCPAVVPVQTDQNHGAATSTLVTWSIGPDTPVNIGMSMAGRQGITWNGFGGVILVGEQSNLATGTFYQGHPLASGAVFRWENIDATTPVINLWAVSNSGGWATMTLGTAW